MTKKKLTVRGSNSAFFKDGKFHTDSQVGCPRITLLRRHGVEEPVLNIRTQKTFAIGHLNEELFIKHYLPNEFVRREGEVKVPITENIDFEGHIDVEIEGMLFELKSVSSNNTWKLVKDGGYKLANLAQAVNYMLARQLQKGYLVYSLYAYVAGIDLPDVFLEIDIDDDGSVLVNKKQTGYTLENIVLDRQAKASVLETDTVYPERPINPGGDKSPCHYCPFKVTCDKFDKKEITDTHSFLNHAREITDASELQQTVNRFQRAGEKKKLDAKRT
jgi:hypothetical protein